LRRVVVACHHHLSGISRLRFIFTPGPSARAVIFNGITIGGLVDCHVATAFISYPELLAQP